MFKITPLHKFLFYSGTSNFCNSILYSVSTTSILSTIQSQHISTFLIGNMVTKDVIGQTVGGLYNMIYSKYIDPKVLICFRKSMLFESAGYAIDFLVPMVSVDYNLGLLSTSSVFKNISFTLSGALHSKSIYNLTTNNNTSEIYTKLNITNTITSGLGMLIGINCVSQLPPVYMGGLLLVSNILRIFTLRKSLQCSDVLI